MSQYTQLTPEQNEIQRSESRAFAESRLVGGILYHGIGNPELPADVISICPPKFFISKYRAVAVAIQSLVKAGLAVDVVSVGREMVGNHQQKPPVSLGELGNLVTSSHVDLSETALMRTAKGVVNEYSKDLARASLGKARASLSTFGEDPDLAHMHIRESLEILDNENTDSLIGLDEKLKVYVSNLDNPAKRQKPMPSPWSNLNRILRGGIQPGELGILAARPSVGKSALALAWSYACSCFGSASLFFSLEMGDQQLLDRLVANLAKINLGNFRTGLSSQEIVRSKQAVDLMRNKPLFIFENPKSTTGEIRRKIRIAQRNCEKVGLVVVDYLQLLTPDDLRISREQQVAQMSRDFKKMAQELNVPILLLSQLNRKVEESNRSPVLSDLRESGAIEQDADIVIFLHPARKNLGNDEPVKVIVAKGRSSGTGETELVFMRKVQRFEESTENLFEQMRQEEYAQANYFESPDL